MIRYLSFFLIGIIILVGIAYKFDWFITKTSQSLPTDTKQSTNKGASPATAIKGYVVKNENLENKISVIGTLIPNEEVSLTTEVAGKITQIFFQEGMKVNKGQTLLKLNDNELQAQLQRLLIQKEVLEQRKKRDEQLLQKQGISEQDWEVLLGELRTKDSEIALTKAQISKTVLIAPFSGMIGLRYVSEGAFVATNTPIAMLADIDNMKLDFAVPEKYSHQISKGTKIEFKVNENTKTFQATVQAVETKIDATTRTLKARALCNNASNELVAGSFTNITILLNRISNTILIPSQALIPEMEAKKVYQVKNGVAVPTKIETGARTEDKVQVLSGLALGDTVIYSGILQVKPNGKVKLIEVN
jgi:membrane fusion protein (multidrug efflux system)